jgi:alkanesulfonate monooxygenase SsuD/methylene tetrahydromethanopterin reductase-like flavin-dependent oxidoreductase (luciferase family)
LFSTASGPDREPYRAYFDHYRSTWASEGRDPAEAYTGISGGFTYLARTTEEAIAGFEPYYANYLATSVGRQNRSPYRDLRDYVERGPTLVGSPADVAAKILDYHSVYRNDAINLLVDALPLTEQREQLEWFAEEVIPIVRREAPTRLWAQADAARPRSTTA